MGLFINEDNEIAWDGMVDNRDQTPITDAVVSARVLDAAQTEVIGATSMAWNATLEAYLGIFDKAETAMLSDTTDYLIEVTAASQGRDGYRLFAETAKYHGRS